MDTIISIISMVVSTLCSAIAGIFAIYTFRKNGARERKQATLDAFNRLQEQALDKLNLYKPSAIVEIAKHPLSEEYKKIGAYVARIEHFCVGVNQKIYDCGVVYELAQGYLDGTIKNRIEPIIARKNRSGRDYYANIHRFFVWMEEERKERDDRAA